MTHIDTESLVALALGEPPGAPQRCHLAGCEMCAYHLAAVVRVFQAAGSSSSADSPPRPPGRLWQAVEEALRRDDASGSRPEREQADAPPTQGSIEQRRAAADTAAKRRSE